MPGPLVDRLTDAQLIKQGAEARVYKLPSLFPAPTVVWPKDQASTSSAPYSPPPVLIKHRFAKQYRHPTLDAQLTRARVSAEARALARCARAGVIAPSVLVVDAENGIIGMEWVEGWSVREVLGGGAEGEEEVEVDAEDLEADEGDEEEGKSEGEQALEKLGVSHGTIMSSIGRALGRLHSAGIVHGDLTTSNMMVRPLPDPLAGTPYQLVLIDFGLSTNASLPEAQAVDLYVLERAFASTHPKSEALYHGVLAAYAEEVGAKRWKLVGKRLEEVRLRGRKRDMTG